MKQLVRPTAIIIAAMLATFVQPVAAAVNLTPSHLPVTAKTAAGESFSIELNPQAGEEILLLTIKNPGRKNLSVTLIGSDGNTFDNFFTGKRYNQMDKKYNFSGADAGVYIIEVTDGVEKIRKQIKLERVIVHSVNKFTVQ